MRTRPLTMGFFNLIMGLLFMYLAIMSAEEGLWTFPTIILMLFATFDIGVSIRLFAINKKLKNKANKSK